MRKLFGYFFMLALTAIVLSVGQGGGAYAAERDKLEAFLKVTGFDVALDSIALTASGAPTMLGLKEDAFGSDWKRLSDQVFSTEVMRKRALDILEATLEDDLLAHAAGYYATDLGQRLVVAENQSHLEDGDLVNTEGVQLVAQMVSAGSPRLEHYKRMVQAIDPSGIGVRAIQEIQIRFLLAASYSGVITLKLDEDGLRAAVAENQGELRRDMAASALANAAYTYQDFTDAEVLAYVKALEHPDMQVVYELMNAVHFEVMSNRFAVLATRMGSLHPGQEL